MAGSASCDSSAVSLFIIIQYTPTAYHILTDQEETHHPRAQINILLNVWTP
jgi:hypothetical protein